MNALPQRAPQETTQETTQNVTPPQTLPRDPDEKIVMMAEIVGQRLRAFAVENNIYLDGEDWIDPARLEPHNSQLAQIFNRYDFSPAYCELRAERIARTAAELCQYRQFHDMAAHWPEMTAQERLEQASFLARMQQFIFAADIIPARTVQITGIEAPHNPGPPPTIQYGAHYAPDPGMRTHEIELNMHPDAGLQNFFNMLYVNAHENQHAFQHGLGQAYADGRIDGAHPLAREARMFKRLDETRVSYIPGARNAYLAHPLEQDAFAASDAFQIAVRDEMQKNRIKLAPGQTWQFRPMNFANTAP